MFVGFLIEGSLDERVAGAFAVGSVYSCLLVDVLVMDSLVEWFQGGLELEDAVVRLRLMLVFATMHLRHNQIDTLELILEMELWSVQQNSIHCLCYGSELVGFLNPD